MATGFNCTVIENLLFLAFVRVFECSCVFGTILILRSRCLFDFSAEKGFGWLGFSLLIGSVMTFVFFGWKEQPASRLSTRSYVDL